MNYIIQEDINSICKEELPWEKLNNKKVLITGANGYLASYIVYSLIHRNDVFASNIKIFALCRNKEKAEKKFKNYLKRNDFELIIQDVVEDIDECFKCDIIIHMASPASVYSQQNSQDNIIKANIIGYMNVLKCAKKWKSERVILYSSGVVYGDITTTEPLEENYRSYIDFENIDKCYSLSKQMCEMITQVYVSQYRMNISVIRPFSVYGPGIEVSQHKHVSDFVKNYMLNENIVLKSDGKSMRDFIYLCDATKGFYYVLLKGEKGQAYNVCNGRPVSVRELAEICQSFDKKMDIEYRIPEGDESCLNRKANSFVGSPSKLQSLGWKNETSLRDGIWRTICWAEDSDFLET